jgi:hypothetical protein
MAERTTETSAHLYDMLGRASHNRRSWAVDALWEGP